MQLGCPWVAIGNRIGSLIYFYGVYHGIGGIDTYPDTYFSKSENDLWNVQKF